MTLDLLLPLQVSGHTAFEEAHIQALFETKLGAAGKQFYEDADKAGCPKAVTTAVLLVCYQKDSRTPLFFCATRR